MLAATRKAALSTTHLLPCLHCCTQAHLPYTPAFEKLAFKNRHDMSLNKRQVPPQKSSQTTERTALPFCASLFFTREKQSSPMHLGRLGLGGPFHLLGPQEESPCPRHITAGPQHVPTSFALWPERPIAT